MATEIDLTTAGSQTTIDGAIFLDSANIGSGTGNYNTFLALSPTPSQSGNEQGFNSDDTPPINSTNEDIDQAKTHTVLLSNVPIIVVNGVEYYEFRVDLNEANSNPNGQISLDQFKIYSSSSGTIESTTTLFTQNLVYNMDGGGDVSLKLSEVSTGSGTDDYAVLVPVSKFAGLDPATTYMYLYVDMGSLGGDYVAAGGFEEWNLQTAGTLKGTKFSDIDSDGVKDAGEPGVAGVTIFIDANKNGVLDAGERSTVTDANGNYTFYGVPLGTWQIDEVTPAGQTQTTGNYETVTISSVGQVVTVDPIGNHIPQPALNVTKTVHDVDGNTTTKVVDKAGDVVNYTITVENTGEVDLTGITVTDKVEAGGATNATYVSGDTDGDNKLDVGETWTYTASYVATQADIDSNGVTGDGDIDNLATADSDQTGPDTDTASVPIVRNPALNVTKTVHDVDGNTTTKVVDKAGDVVNYTITVENTGNVTLTGITVTDQVEAGGATNATYVSGDTDGDNKLDVGETWTYTASYVATQADIDSNGVTGDGDIDNLATADSNETDPDTATASVPIVRNPALNVTKTVHDVDGNTTTKVVDKAGDVVNYTITVENTGNVTLTGITVTDKVEAGGATNATYVSGDTDGDNKLDVGETWTYTASYVATQADIDSNGVTGDGDIDNLATADSNETDPDTATASVPIVLNPDLAITKAAVVEDGHADHAGDLIDYTVVVTNTGNVALTGVVVTDTFEGGAPVILTNFNSATNTFSGDTDGDGKLDVGEVWTYTYKHTLTQSELDTQGVDGDGSLDNVASVTTNETGPDEDDAHIPVELGPGVRTPGFWSQNTGQNQWTKFWDGIVGNEPKQAGTNGFADGEITYAVDSNHDGVINNSDQKGLLIGDYDKDGIEDPGENVLFISTADALTLLNASSKQVQDGRYMLGRDLVATWLNYLEGNAIGDGTAGTAKYDINQSVYWFEATQASPGASTSSADFHTLSVKDDLSSGAIKTSSPLWTSPIDVVVLGQPIHTDLAASTLHSQLDHYNNFGSV
ncbi:DUF7507 domain-containing protein [Bradyrhizobium sp. DOA9]|uniref:DUF7507 domain-containing protein n=1 Tax=Bradyrhizobium sp. DOA9 TaxID=1126627 RepID=UPI00046A1491|nr:SdrD B-like domain-containing protein [Bradyrhizobium sp. DOA9]GAJ30861.1 hypothetical protein BDOA9_0100320 [Bradyrhizobium sp. DOA9]